MKKFQVSKSCNRQPHPLSVTRGVRSRPLSDAASTKAETVPLLSPTMESELLKESWVFPRTTASPTKAENTATASAWEEDFQDLSSWCMDTFQGQYDFHIGTKYDGNGVSIAEEEELLKDLRSSTDDERLNLKMDTVKTTKKLSDNHHLPLSPSELVNEYGLGYSNEKNNASSSWLSPESTASTSTSSSKQYNAEVNAPLQSECHINDVDYICPTTFNTNANQLEIWDELRTIETTGSFDLLSYVCDDEIRSPESNISTDSSAMPKIKQPATTTSSRVFSPVSTKVKTEEEVNETARPKRRRMETRATSTITSSAMETVPAVPSRRSERTRITAVNGDKERGEKAISKIKTRDKSERKRYYDESESEEDVVLTQYRECREKNNEASRRSRMNKKVKESEMATRAIDLERDNKILKMKVEELEKLVTSMRNALLRCALKKEF